MESHRIKILLALSNGDLRHDTEQGLVKHNYIVNSCSDGFSALRIFHSWKCDLCLLDYDLIGRDAFRVAQDIRKANPVIPVIILNTPDPRINGSSMFRLKCDDHISKPFSMDEVIAHIRVKLKDRIVSSVTQLNRIFNLGRYSFDFSKRSLYFLGDSVALTVREADLLQMLCMKGNQVLTYKEISDRLWGEANHLPEPRIAVLVTQLRKKLRFDGSIRILNTHGKGYRLVI